jgi:hypothetical protein
MEIEEMYSHVHSSPFFSLVASSSMGALELEQGCHQMVLLRIG